MARQTAEKMRIVHTSARRGKNGRWIMTSPELPGFIQIGEDLQTLTSQTPVLMAQLLELDYGTHVEVVEIEQPKKQRLPIARMVQRPQVTHWWGAPPLPC